MNTQSARFKLGTHVRVAPSQPALASVLSVYAGATERGTRRLVLRRVVVAMGALLRTCARPSVA